MMHRELDLSPDIQERIKVLKSFAEANPIPESLMKHISKLYAAGEPLPSNEEYRLDIPVGWSVAYTIEDHGHALLRRLRVAHDVPEKVPPHEAMALLMTEFGFTTPADVCVFIPEANDNDTIALNAMEPINESMESFLLRMTRFSDAKGDENNSL